MIRHLYVVQIKPGIITRMKSGSALSRVGVRKGILPIRIFINQTDVVLTKFGKLSNSVSGRKECVVLYGLRSRDIKR